MNSLPYPEQNRALPWRLITPLPAACALAGLIFLSVAIVPGLRSTFGKNGWRNDFVSFYSGAKLLSTCQMYSYNSVFEMQKHLGMTDSTAMVYIRPPFYAAIMRPLSALPYEMAYAVFQVLSMVSFAFGIALWRHFGWGLCLILGGWNVAMAMTLLRGQDVAFVLLIASLSAHLLRKGQHFGAGATFALALIKWHLLVPIVILILANRLLRFALGFAAAGIVLIGIAFYECPDWPVQYRQALRQSETSLQSSQMPNIRGLFSSTSGTTPVELVVIIACAALCWWALKSPANPDVAIALCLLAGVILSVHAYAYDCVLILPGAAAGLSRVTQRWGIQSICAVSVAVCPVLLLSPVLRVIPQVGLIILMVWICVHRIKATQETALA